MCGPHDGIILRQDAVYLCLRDDICWPTQQMFVLDSDLAVRQVCAPSYISVVSAAHWVELCSKATQNILWQN